MFETMEEVISLAACGITALSAIGGLIASLAKGLKNKRLAAKAEAISDIAALAKEKIVETEKTFSKASQVLKATGVDTGEIKKSNVMDYIESRCIEKGVEFDESYWSNQIESLIEVMNANKKNRETANERR